MARRPLNRKSLRADHDAAEARKKSKEAEENELEEEEDDDEEEEEEEEGDGEEDGDDSGDDAGDDSGDDDGGDDDEDRPKAKKKKPKKPVVEKKPRKSRAAKVVRMKMVWGVFSNSNNRVATYDYPKKKDADEHAKKLTTDKKSGGPFFVQPVREPLEG